MENEWGIGIHMGQAFGIANQIVLLLAYVAIVLMAVSAAVTWWKRRPAGSLGAPIVPSDWRVPRAILAIAVLAGIFFPLVGLSLLVVAAIEFGVYATARGFDREHDRRTTLLSNLVGFGT